MSEKPIYLNFPVSLLRDAFIDIRNVMGKIMRYAGYIHTLNLTNGTNTKKMKDAGDFFGITYGSPTVAYEEGREIANGIRGKTPMTGINKGVMFDFYDNPKSQDEIAVLLAFLGIKSMLGKHPFLCITNRFLIARMGGYSSIADMPEELPQPLAGYFTRRKMERIRFELRTGWGVNFYSDHIKGYYTSFENSFSLDKLIFEAEKNRKHVKESQLKKKQDEAKERAMQQL